MGVSRAHTAPSGAFVVVYNFTCVCTTVVYTTLVQVIVTSMHNFLDDRDQIIEDDTPEDEGDWDFDRERDNQLQEDHANGVW